MTFLTVNNISKGLIKSVRKLGKIKRAENIGRQTEHKNKGRQTQEDICEGVPSKYMRRQIQQIKWQTLSPV